MRIFTAVRHSNDPAMYYGGLWSGNFYPALRELGCEVIESQIDLLPTSRFMITASAFTPEELEVRARTTELILDEVRAALKQGPVNLFLSYFYNSHFDPAGFDELRRLGIPSVNFYCNSIYQFSLVASIAAKADYSWHAERDARESYLSIGANPVWVQMGADPSLYYPVQGEERRPKSVFIGQKYADRDRWIAALIRAGIPIEIFGAGWRTDEEKTDKRVPDEKTYLGRKSVKAGSVASYTRMIVDEVRRSGLRAGLHRVKRQAQYRRGSRNISGLLSPSAKGHASNIASVLAAYEVCLNFSNVWADGRPGSSLIPHVRLRDFEAPMCRTCYLTGHTDEIGEFYKLGKEIDTYRTVDELIDKVKFYLSNTTQAEQLRAAGYKRAISNHTWKHRFEELFGKIKLN